MIHAPVVLAAVGLVAWAYEARSRRAYEATLSPAEKQQFRAYCRGNPSWRGFMRLNTPSATMGKASPLADKAYDQCEINRWEIRG